MTGVPWEEMTSRWKDLYNEQAKVAQQWVESQTQLATTLSGMGGEAGMPADAAAMAELWRSAMALGSTGVGLPGLEATGIANDTIGKMLDPVSMSLMGGNRVGEAIRRMTEGPRFADIGAAEHRMAKLFGLWMSVQTAARKYERIVAGAWMKANQEFAREIATRSRTETEVRGSKQALRLWLEIADKILIETHRTPEFLEAQQQLLAQGMDFLLAEREFVEALVEPAGLPTRTEIDEIHQTVQDLKRKVRALEKAAANQAARAPRKATTGRHRPPSGAPSPGPCSTRTAASSRVRRC